MIYVGMLFFAYAVIDGKDISFKKKLLIAGLLLPTVLLLSTRFALIQYDLSNCNREAIEGPIAFYGYAVEVLFSLWILGFGVKRFFERKKGQERRKVVLAIFGIVFFIFSFAMGNVIGSLLVDWTIGQYGLFGIPIFVAFLAYLIVRYKTFNIKLIGAQVLVVSLWITLSAVLFVRTIENVRIIVSLTLILFLVVGILLVRSVLKEVKQREEIARMAEDVRRAYEIEKRAKDESVYAYAIEKKAKEELEKLDKIKNQFLAQTQHDLRTPLGIIRDYCDLLSEGAFGRQSKKALEIIKRVQGVAQNKIKDVNNFLDTTQFQLGKKVVSLKPGIEIKAILDEIVNESKFQAEAKGIYLIIQKPEREFIVEADREKLKAALFNIIDNSIKYTPTGGVTIELKNHDIVKIVISDTGIGIPKEKLATLFDNAFERGEQAKKTFVTGRGIGLYLSAQIIKAHNGKVWVQSQGEGKGSVFHIELPIQL